MSKAWILTWLLITRAASVEDAEWSRAGLTDGVSGGGSLPEIPAWFHQLDQCKTLEQRRKALLIRHRGVLDEAEHLLMPTSIGGAGGIALIAGLLSWRGHRQRLLDRDLHDEIGSKLGSIALISSFADQQDAARMQLDLAEIEMVARESADSMRDMVAMLGGRRSGATADRLNVTTRTATVSKTASRGGSAPVRPQEMPG